MRTERDTITSDHLALTERGARWLQQFDLDDQEIAKDLLSSLMLVSHNEFERGLTDLIIFEADKIDGPVALFATREVIANSVYFSNANETIDAVGRGGDLGSEARVAALIRNICRSQPRKYLNHPTIEDMRTAQCRALFAVDDFVGSGQRVISFLEAMWQSATLRSWCSLHLLSIKVLAYSTTAKGKRAVERSPPKPSVYFQRDCPTFHEMPWLHAKRKQMIGIIKKYGRRTSRRTAALGYRFTAASIVFEHGCPNNCPAILWAPTTKKSTWLPLFPERTVLFTEASSFPPEIARRDAVLVMIEAGQQRLAASRSLSAPGAISREALIILGLAARGIRSRAALSHATGLPSRSCAQLLERCIQSGLLTPTLRMTSSGLAELDHARKAKILPDRVPSRGTDSYYPQKLRRPVDG